MNVDQQATEALKIARDLIANAGWCQDAPFKGFDGEELDWPDFHQRPGDVCSFCATAAMQIGISNVAGEGPRLDLEDIVEDRLRYAIREGHIVSWNDRPGRTKKEVIRAFDRAIKGENDG